MTLEEKFHVVISIFVCMLFVCLYVVVYLYCSIYLSDRNTDIYYVIYYDILSCTLYRVMMLLDRGFRIAHLNCQSMKNKLDVLNYQIHELNIEVFTLSETWLSPNFPDGLSHVEQCDFMRWDNRGRSEINEEGI